MNREGGGIKPKIIQTTWTINVEVPSVPNFLLEREIDDINECGKYPISDFSDDVLKLVGEAWTEKLLARAAEMRRNKKK